MRAFPAADLDPEKNLAMVSALAQDHDGSCTKRVAELEARIARLRAELEEAEIELERERNRLPAPGDFVRCPLTNFYGRVTKVTRRPTGRPWIEIVPYLGPDLPGHSTMDLFDSWELIDPPSHHSDPLGADDGSPRMPTIAPFMPASRPALDPPGAQDDIEGSLRSIWMPSSGSSS